MHYVTTVHIYTLLHRVSEKNWTLLLFHHIYELHENFQKYTGSVVIVNMK